MPSYAIKRIPKDSVRLVQEFDREWRFDYPRITAEHEDRFSLAIDTWQGGDPRGGLKMMRELASELPEYIDVHHHIALILSQTGQVVTAIERWQKVCEDAWAQMPRSFVLGRDHLPWIMLENRGFLRAYHGFGVTARDLGWTRDAIYVFNDLLDLNPDDNQGIRALAVDAYLQANRAFDVLSVCARYPDDAMPETLYGRVLAWLILGEETEASKALDRAYAAAPHVARELVKKTHRRPKDLNPYFVAMGGADEAYLYWDEQGQHWKSLPSAIEFVRAYLSEREA